jgi:hypothetical protein
MGFVCPEGCLLEASPAGCVHKGTPLVMTPLGMMPLRRPTEAPSSMSVTALAVKAGSCLFFAALLAVWFNGNACRLALSIVSSGSYQC